MKGRPHWPLQRVKNLAKEGKLFIQRTRALDFFTSFKEAMEIAQSVVQGLEISNFSHTIQLTYDIADVYGVLIEGCGWYLKLTIDEKIPELVVISFILSNDR